MAECKEVPELLFEQKHNIVFLKFNRSKALNAINKNIIKLLHEALDYCATNDSVVAVIVEGEGRAFSAGGDILGAYKAKQSGSNFVDFFKEEYLFNVKLHNFHKPYLSIYNGIVMGGGVGNSIYGKYKIATENTLWAMPEAGIGFFTDVGASYFTQKLPLSLALFICLTGARLNASDCMHLGFATHYVKEENLENFKQAIIENLKFKTWKKDKKEIFSIFEQTLKIYQSTPVNTNFTAEKNDLIEKCFVNTSVADILNNLTYEKKQGNVLADEILRLFTNLSPLSLLIIFKHLNESRNLSLEECMNIDYTIMYNMLHGSDFYEGVRAILVDKDKNPNWHYKNIEAIDESTLQSYFYQNDKLLF